MKEITTLDLLKFCRGKVLEQEKLPDSEKDVVDLNSVGM
jgi:hypothetical protein